MNRPPDMRQLLKQAQMMQEQMAATQEELAARTYEGTAGGGAVKVTVNGANRLLSVVIGSTVIDPADPELLADLVMVAVNQALEAASRDASAAMTGLTGGLDLGGLLG
ncbi:MAG TPA: YbaB/EbfC family nucleoid-associated protein [Acidimicrobiia bacterium]|nr:YbaB/EbfC family nucleoid-associated protein [Acidimicrobiia bacterium]